MARLDTVNVIEICGEGGPTQSLLTFSLGKGD